MPSPATCINPIRPPRRPSQAPLLASALPTHRCWSWRCPGCALLMAKDVRTLIRQGVNAALTNSDTLVLLTITEHSNPRELSQASKALTALTKRLRAKFNPQLRWISVLEWQQRGAPHFHVLVRGLSYNRAVRARTGAVYPGHERGQPGGVRKEQDLRPLIERYGFGPVFEIHAVGVNSDPLSVTLGVAGYLSKYLTKASRYEKLPKGARPVRCSVGRWAWAPGFTLTSLREQAKHVARTRTGAAWV